MTELCNSRYYDKWADEEYLCNELKGHSGSHKQTVEWEDNESNNSSSIQ